MLFRAFLHTQPLVSPLGFPVWLRSLCIHRRFPPPPVCPPLTYCGSPNAFYCPKFRTFIVRIVQFITVPRAVRGRFLVISGCFLTFSNEFFNGSPVGTSGKKKERARETTRGRTKARDGRDSPFFVLVLPYFSLVRLLPMTKARWLPAILSRALFPMRAMVHFLVLYSTYFLFFPGAFPSVFSCPFQSVFRFFQPSPVRSDPCTFCAF